MSELVQIVIWNVAWAGVFAALALAISIVVKNPFVVRLLWLCVLVKLVLPSPIHWNLPETWVSGRSLSASSSDVVSAKLERAHPIGESSNASPHYITVTDELESQVLRSDDAAHLYSNGSEKTSDGQVILGYDSRLKLPSPAAADSTNPVDERRNNAPITQVDSSISTVRIRWLWPIAIVWCLGSLLWLTITLRRIHRFARRVVLAAPAPADLRRMAQKLSEVFELRKVPEIRVVSGRIAPMVWHCFARPIIILPQALLETLSPNDTRQVLAHEICHIKRRDYLCRYFEMFVLAVYWWNPIAWFARARLQRAEEACCDASVLAVLDEGVKGYTKAIYRAIHWMADCNETLPAGASGFGYADSLRQRFRNILTRNGRNVMSLRLHCCCVLSAAVVLIAAGKVRLEAQDVADGAGAALAESAADESGEADGPVFAETVSGFTVEFTESVADESTEPVDETSPPRGRATANSFTWRRDDKPRRDESVEARLDRLEAKINALVEAMQGQARSRRGNNVSVLAGAGPNSSDALVRRWATVTSPESRPVVSARSPATTTRANPPASARVAVKPYELERRVQEQQMLIKALQRENELLRDKLESVIQQQKASRN